MESLFQDLRFGARWLLRSKGFTFVAVGCLALGIATLTTVFSLSNAFFLRPLPFAEPERLVHVWQTDSQLGYDRLRVSVPNFEDWRQQLDAFEDLGGYYYTTYTESGESGPGRKVEATLLTPNLLPLLDVAPERGRAFTMEDLARGEKVALISQRLQRSRFGDASGVGENVVLDGQRYTVIGVMPQRFNFPFNATELWVPLDLTRWQEQRGENGPLLVVGRLAPKATREGAQAALTSLMARLERDHPDTNRGKGARIVELRSVLLFTYDIFRVVFPVLLVATGLVLVLISANLGNLLLARATGRSREIAFRLTLGATRGRVLRQLLTESVLLALLGGLVGAGLARFAAAGLERALPLDLFRVGAIEVDGPALAVALLVALAAALLFGLAPALQASQPGVTRILREGSSTGSGRTARLRNALVVAQLTLATVLVCGAFLMGRTLRALKEVPLGFEPKGVLSMEVVLPATTYDTEAEQNHYFDDALARARSVPGVVSAATVYPLPLNHELMSETFEVEGQAPPVEGEQRVATQFWVSPGYLATMRIPLLAGRDLSGQDVPEALPVALINETMARRFFASGGEVGRRVKIEGAWRTVVGVVGDSIAFSLDEPAAPALYLPQSQDSTRRRFVLARSAGDPLALAKPVQAAVAAVDPAQPVTNVRSLEQVLLEWMGPWLMGIAGVAGIGLGALLLASMGLYGVISYGVVQRTRELALRTALGAEQGTLVRGVLRQGLGLAGLGVAAGCVAALGLTKLLQGLLFGVQALDPLTFTATPAVLVATALAAAWFPARRAASVPPAEVLRG